MLPSITPQALEVLRIVLRLRESRITQALVPIQQIVHRQRTLATLVAQFLEQGFHFGPGILFRFRWRQRILRLK